jgi:hypothetical protein
VCDYVSFNIALGVDLVAQDKHLEGNTKSTIVSSTCVHVFMLVSKVLAITLVAHNII